MKIRNLDNLTPGEIQWHLQNGAKFVIFHYCISIIAATFRRSSDIYFIKPGESTFKKSWPFTLLTIVLGWWGIPWGPIYSIGSLTVNIGGGKDVTREVLLSLAQAHAKSVETDTAGVNTSGKQEELLGTSPS